MWVSITREKGKMCVRKSEKRELEERKERKRKKEKRRFFFFKQKTAYEIYQCDWSSDVCSSDLIVASS